MKINLSNTQLFRGIEEADVASLLQCLAAFQKSYKKGEVILPEGAPSEYIGIVLSGMAMIAYNDVWGNNSILGSAAPGAVFADAYACIPGEPLLVSVYAAEDTTILFMNIGRVLSTCTNTCTFHARHSDDRPLQRKPTDIR